MNNEMSIETCRCCIRKLAVEDAADLYKTLSDEKVMEYIEPAFDMEQVKEFIEDAGLCDPPLVYALVWKETGEVIGHVIFHQYEEESYEIGWIIRREYWGRGIAGEVTAALVEYASELGGINSCVIECDPEQEVSKRIALKHGFVYEGEDDGCHVYRLRFSA